MKLLKAVGMKGSILPKVRLMPKWGDLTGIKNVDLGPSFVPKRKKRRGLGKIFKEV